MVSTAEALFALQFCAVLIYITQNPIRGGSDWVLFVPKHIRGTRMLNPNLQYKIVILLSQYYKYFLFRWWHI